MTQESSLYRSANNKTLGGVCAGLADKFRVDVVVFRLLFVLAMFAGGGGFLIYIILWIVLPEKNTAVGSTQESAEEEAEEEAEEVLEDSTPEESSSSPNTSSLIVGLLLVSIGLLFLVVNFWPSTRVLIRSLWPVLLIIAGLFLLANSRKSNK